MGPRCHDASMFEGLIRQPAAAFGAALWVFRLLSGCAGTTAPAEVPKKPFEVLPDSCPTEKVSPGGKIWDEQFVDGHKDMTFRVAFTLTDDGFPEIPSCPSGAGRNQRCAERDSALAERESLNFQQVKCVREAVGGFGTAGGVTLWYERPYHFSSGRPAAVALMFTAAIDMKELEIAAAHPYIARIEPIPGEARFLGALAPEPPKECPTNTEPGLPKLADATHGSGRQSFMVDVRDHGVLPEAPTDEELQASSGDASCPGGPPCEAALQTVWERVILNCREVTCVKRAMDRLIHGTPLQVRAGSALLYDNLSRTLGPLGQQLSVTASFGIGITWDDAVKVAGHPYVERIWDGVDAVPFGGAQPEGCPPDYTKPIPTPECTNARESPDGKFSAQDQQRWEGATGPTDVGIQLREVGPICPGATSCPSDPEPCPARDMYIAWRQAANEASQKCVRDLIQSLGASIDPGDTIWLINALYAQLTWDQIQAVAALPEVIGISSSDEGSPPP